MTRGIRKNLNDFLDVFERAGYPVERCRVFFHDMSFTVYIWSDWMEDRKPEVAHDAFDYFNAIQNETMENFCRGVWIEKRDGGYIVR